jgi:peptidase E
MRRILAIGGGGFLMEDVASPIDAFILELTGKPKPRVCYLGTPSGDIPDGIEKFYKAFPVDRCEPSHLAFFRMPSPGSAPLAHFHKHLIEQDAIFVGGGNTKSALGVWREWTADRTFREADARGVLLCGVSAGAMCWFEAGITDSFWGAGYQPLSCLGLLEGGCAVHYNSDPQRRARLHSAIKAGTAPGTIAIDDLSAALYEDDLLARVVRWGKGAGAYAVRADSERVIERLHESISIDAIPAHGERA